MKKLNKIFLSAEMKEIDDYAVDSESISSLQLMERAAGCWTEEFVRRFGDYLCFEVISGNGNNGGDGYAVARMLKMRGKSVRVWHVAAGGEISPDCGANRERFRETGGEIVELREAGKLRFDAEVLVIDALFGTGVNRPVSGLAGEVIRHLNGLPNRVVALDMPSGLMGEDNSGNDPETIVQADYTLTLQFPKLSLMLPENCRFAGRWSVVDFGLQVDGAGTTPYYYLTEDVVARMLPPSDKFAHKGANGHGLLVAGCRGMMGGAVLAAKAAVRSGVGLLSCHIPESERGAMYVAVPEALIDADESAYRFSGVTDLERFDAVAVGPALGKGPETVDALRSLLVSWRGTTVLDADALNIISEHREMLDLLHRGCILTPHVREFERLAGKCANDFERLNKLSTFAGRYGVHVLLKGAHSVVASPDGKFCFNTGGNPGMAKGGAGDVLTGVLLALAAGGMEPWEAALVGMYAHGLAGDIAAGKWGERGLCSGMLAEGMGKAWKRLEQSAGRFC